MKLIEPFYIKEIFIPININGTITNDYHISNYGNVFSFELDRLLNLSKDKDGYLYCTLSLKNIGRKNIRVHRAVLMSFNYILGCENLQVNHYDGIKSNNFIFNLYWCTGKENIKHSYDSGLNTNYGENHFRTYLSDENVRLICENISKGKRSNITCDMLGINKNDRDTRIKMKYIISNIKKKKSWVRISDDYF